jgi:hypothetical protein
MREPDEPLRLFDDPEAPAPLAEALRAARGRGPDDERWKGMALALGLGPLLPPPPPGAVGPGAAAPGAVGPGAAAPGAVGPGAAAPGAAATMTAAPIAATGSLLGAKLIVVALVAAGAVTAAGVTGHLPFVQRHRAAPVDGPVPAMTPRAPGASVAPPAAPAANAVTEPPGIAPLPPEVPARAAPPIVTPPRPSAPTLHRRHGARSATGAAPRAGTTATPAETIVPASAPTTPAAGAPAAAAPSPAAPTAAATAAPPPAAPPSKTASRLREEAALVRQAERQLASDPAAALRLTDERRRRFPDGALDQEAEVVTIDALLRLGRRTEATMRAHAFEAAHAGSLHARRIRRLIGE